VRAIHSLFYYVFVLFLVFLLVKRVKKNAIQY